ncbi:hypothetical protein [Streptomyces iconiensis]|uniref:Uncharacterized protein n=1 Tax=Streptomyces iconiensis TaxID=1384038 RepID=A0ABT6ZZR8_9ACTN|nr:hypothetical protein [Streptomyces iconiensis]MDJ1134571.1 hypothetical protein [Streptomyces iconiensis]
MNSALVRMRVLASLVLALTVVLGVLGVTVLVPDAGLEGDMVFWIPAAVSVFALLGVHYAADPLLLPRSDPSPRRTARAVYSMMSARLLASGVTAVAGVAIGMATQSDPAVLVGSGASVVMLAHWWPGKQFANTVRAKLARTGGARYVGPALHRTGV